MSMAVTLLLYNDRVMLQIQSVREQPKLALAHFWLVYFAALNKPSSNPKTSYSHMPQHQPQQQ